MNENIVPPVPASYWILYGKILGGCHPYFSGEENPQDRLSALIKAGITLFFDLTEERERKSYGEIVTEISVRLGIKATYRRFPIKDHDIPSEMEMVTVLNAIDAALANEDNVYIHCGWGIGRTGTVAGCYFVRHGLTGKEALVKLESIKKNSDYKMVASIPQTAQQCAMVENWFEK